VLAGSRINLGELLVGRRRWVEAESLLVRGVDVRAAANLPNDAILEQGRKALETLRTARRH